MKTKTQLIVSIYGALQSNMRSLDLVDTSGRPGKFKDLPSNDVINLYEYFAKKIVKVEAEFEAYTNKYNEAVTNLSEEYRLNNFALVIFISERFLLDFGSHIDTLVIMPKIIRLIAVVKSQVDHSVFIESQQAAANIYDIISGKEERTKEARAKAFKLRT
jgi:hypothetical protein